MAIAINGGFHVEQGTTDQGFAVELQFTPQGVQPGEPGIPLLILQQQVQADRSGTLPGHQGENLGQVGPRPGPAADGVNALGVNGDDGDLVGATGRPQAGQLVEHDVIEGLERRRAEQHAGEEHGNQQRPGKRTKQKPFQKSLHQKESSHEVVIAKQCSDYSIGVTYF